MARLGLGPHLADRIGSGVRVSASFQIFASRMLLLHSGRLPPEVSLGVIYGRISPWRHVLEFVCPKFDVRQCKVRSGGG